ncbi:MAG: hypothetical protein RL293_1141 [Bacteroidota bacterium]|jgi:hypothetical protein
MIPLFRCRCTATIPRNAVFALHTVPLQFYCCGTSHRFICHPSVPFNKVSILNDLINSSNSLYLI